MKGLTKYLLISPKLIIKPHLFVTMFAKQRSASVIILMEITIAKNKNPRSPGVTIYN